MQVKAQEGIITFKIPSRCEMPFDFNFQPCTIPSLIDLLSPNIPSIYEVSQYLKFRPLNQIICPNKIQTIESFIRPNKITKPIGKLQSFSGHPRIGYIFKVHEKNGEIHFHKLEAQLTVIFELGVFIDRLSGII
ncbi:hypothetical protein Ancab_030042 [Ancistrocladus abbreviatus]